MYGAHLKASAAMVRLRLYDVLALLPTQSFESKPDEHCHEIICLITCMPM